MSDDEELMEISFEPAHAAGCNYYLRPLGSPGCICAVVNRNELAELRAEVGRLRKAAKSAGFEFIPVPGGYTCIPQSPQVLVSQIDQLRTQLASVERERDEAEQKLKEWFQRDVGEISARHGRWSKLESELTTLTAQLTAEREKRAALVRKWRDGEQNVLVDPVLEQCADQLAALDSNPAK